MTSHIDASYITDLYGKTSRPSDDYRAFGILIEENSVEAQRQAILRALVDMAKMGEGAGSFHLSLNDDTEWLKSKGFDVRTKTMLWMNPVRYCWWISI